MDNPGKNVWPGEIPGPASPPVGIAGGEDLVIPKKRGGSLQQPKPTKLADCTAGEENSKWQLTPSVMQAYNAMRGPGASNEVLQREDPLLKYVYQQEAENHNDASLLDDIHRGMGPHLNADLHRKAVFEYDKPSNMKHIKPYMGYNQNQVSDQNSLRGRGWRVATGDEFGSESGDTTTAHGNSGEHGTSIADTGHDYQSTATPSKASRTRMSSKVSSSTAAHSPITTVLPTPPAYQTTFKHEEDQSAALVASQGVSHHPDQLNSRGYDSIAHQEDVPLLASAHGHFPVGSLESDNAFPYQNDGPAPYGFDEYPNKEYSEFPQDEPLPLLGLSGMPASQSGITSSYTGKAVDEEEFSTIFDRDNPEVLHLVGLSGLPIPSMVQLPPLNVDKPALEQTDPTDTQVIPLRSALQNFVEEGFISDEEGDPEKGRISPCTFALWAGGARRWDADQPDKPLFRENDPGCGLEMTLVSRDNSDKTLAEAASLKRTRPSSGHDLSTEYKDRRQWLTTSQYDEEDGEPMSPVYDVPQQPSVIWTPPGICAEQIEPNERTAKISRMDPAVGLAMREVLFGKPDVEEVAPFGKDEAYDSLIWNSTLRRPKEELLDALDSYPGPIYGGVPPREVPVYLEHRRRLIHEMEQSEASYRHFNAMLTQKLDALSHQSRQVRECADILALRRDKEEKAKRIRQHVGTVMRDLRWKVHEQHNRTERELRENLELTAQVERAEEEIREACRRAGVRTPEKLFEEFSKLTSEEMLGNFATP